MSLARSRGNEIYNEMRWGSTLSRQSFVTPEEVACTLGLFSEHTARTALEQLREEGLVFRFFGGYRAVSLPYPDGRPPETIRPKH